MFEPIATGEAGKPPRAAGKLTLGEGNDGGGGTGTLRVLEDLGGSSLEDGDTRVGGSEVDTDDGARDLRVPAPGADEGGRRALRGVSCALSCIGPPTAAGCGRAAGAAGAGTFHRCRRLPAGTDSRKQAGRQVGFGFFRFFPAWQCDLVVFRGQSIASCFSSFVAKEKVPVPAAAAGR